MSGTSLGVPSVSGMDINGVIYQYTTVKNPSDPFTVTLSHENAITGGDLFSETDDWSGLPGSTINKALVFPYIPIEYWGNGSLTTEGIGEIEEPSVIYTYRIDPVVEIPELPELPEVYVYDALNDDAVNIATQETDSDLYDDQDSRENDDEKDEEKQRLERGLAASVNSLTLATAISQDAVIAAMNLAVNMSTYYSATIPGGVYGDSVILSDKELPKNNRGRRIGLAQQLLHDQMVDMQYMEKKR